IEEGKYHVEISEERTETPLEKKENLDSYFAKILAEQEKVKQQEEAAKAAAEAAKAAEPGAVVATAEGEEKPAKAEEAKPVEAKEAKVKKEKK
ncbi:MAG: hypothetical protein U1B79_00120, partial [Candidatus Pacearchaeota archaeon]|nr:hypothetical protein [Candidatus Pacearchaeota archaeon]